MSVLRFSTASKTMSPPRPPSPPSGPPNSMNFSRRNATAPAPPSPLFRKIFAWSRNFMALPEALCAIGVEETFVGDERQVLKRRLRDQHAVERVLVMAGQGAGV